MAQEKQKKQDYDYKKSIQDAASEVLSRRDPEGHLFNRAEIDRRWKLLLSKDGKTLTPQEMDEQAGVLWRGLKSDFGLDILQITRVGREFIGGKVTDYSALGHENVTLALSDAEKGRAILESGNIRAAAAISMLAVRSHRFDLEQREQSSRLDDAINYLGKSRIKPFSDSLSDAQYNNNGLNLYQKMQQAGFSDPEITLIRSVSLGYQITRTDKSDPYYSVSGSKSLDELSAELDPKKITVKDMKAFVKALNETGPAGDDRNWVRAMIFDYAKQMGLDLNDAFKPKNAGAPHKKADAGLDTGVAVADAGGPESDPATDFAATVADVTTAPAAADTADPAAAVTVRRPAAAPDAAPA